MLLLVTIYYPSIKSIESQINTNSDVYVPNSNLDSMNEERTDLSYCRDANMMKKEEADNEQVLFLQCCCICG
jgi:hypothetical protein